MEYQLSIAKLEITIDKQEVVSIEELCLNADITPDDMRAYADVFTSLLK